MSENHRPYFMTDGYRVHSEAIERIYGKWSKEPFEEGGGLPFGNIVFRMI
ncbi:MAG: hypothetical protein FWG96_05815 [Methanomassiliicoccaceae archaeon]|nr:hypothetical protein [Methanomassiliicoccaceae archaeon]